jgi:type I restriction enzyme R subunit
MSAIGQSERATQQRVIKLFCQELGYRYLGDWSARDGNSNIEVGLLTDWLTARGHDPAQIGRVLDALQREANNHNRSLYGITRRFTSCCATAYRSRPSRASPARPWP